MNKERYIFNFQTALEAILNNRFRAILTALGIIFGVAAVISMLAIGNGAKQEILDQVKLIGLNNIVVKARIPPSKTSENSKGAGKVSAGLTFGELKALKAHVPGIRALSPEVELKSSAIAKGENREVKVLGVSEPYFKIKNMEILTGQSFGPMHLKASAPVCVIGSKVASTFYGTSTPVGERLKVNDVWLTVIGVLRNRNVTQAARENLGIEDLNNLVYVPYSTMLTRISNRKRIDKARLQDASVQEEDEEQSKPDKKEVSDYHELDKAVIQLESADHLNTFPDFLARYLLRNHNGVQDFEIQVPRHLLEQQQKTKDVFNIVLGAIAGISLVVGGIGIMNIMLASVYERIKEIGLRIALGAYKVDIIRQFLFEAVLICVSGGIIGIILGIGLSLAIEQLTDIQTIISLSSIFLSFFVAVITGIVFGLAPARKAANQDPISSLRHD